MYYQVNACVKGPLPFQPWVPVVLSLDGQRLSVDHRDTTTKAFDTVGCSATATDAPFVVRVQFRNGKKLVLDVGSHGLQAQLIQQLMTPSAHNNAGSVYDQLVRVATAINDRAPLAKKSDLPPSGISVADVQAHLCGLKIVYDHVAGLPSPLALYDWLLDTEAAYVYCHRDLHGAAHPEVYAHCVYQQDPLSYALGTTSSEERPDATTYVGVCAYCRTEFDAGTLQWLHTERGAMLCTACDHAQRLDAYFKNQFGSTAYDMPLRLILAACPNRRCTGRFSLADMRRMHELEESVACPGCRNLVTYETYQIATFLREHPTITCSQVGLPKRTYTTRIPPVRAHEGVGNRILTEPKLPVDGRWSTYLATMLVNVQVYVRASAVHDDAAIWLFREEIDKAVDMIRAHDNGAFPIDLVRAMHRDLRFVAKIGPMTHYWSNPTVVAAAIRRYEQFMHLSKTHKHLVPTLDIALLWRVHMTQHVAYCAYSRAIAKKVLSPQWNSYDDAAYVKTCVAWTKAYREPYSSYVPTGTVCARATSWLMV
ncbi:hypothetical protein SPRG_03488 [Saprolegnia parasitica CBS 223.65]|uniref:Uncharacterized protein n=1 Tax=Saprolegnia parasitica (strain CBS 223.65) TaxID=695850 RepID=A0A067CLI3_SAPPC|nr:hypothetical protein SPRG_03488 [Saprolegnia parasitica CBS 223.65]KDO31559.1 hypothetical protein SPRG_03488 [Saprolegnia parasitica CBS 223.65]|eukprot:XP_012197466.1 hypothetical protein SPRG_03488 [Saprolegnia parasitica CBS 223.65]